jgi:hypothetical protein
MFAVGLNELVLWVRGLASYSHDVSVQREMPSLTGLYVAWAPYAVRTVLGALLLAGALAATVWQAARLRWRGPVPLSAVAWLWFAWFLVMPYIHFQDEILLAAPLLAVLGRGGRNLRFRAPALALCAMILTPVFVVWSPFRADLLAVPLLVAAVCVYLSGRLDTPPGSTLSPAPHPGQ